MNQRSEFLLHLLQYAFRLAQALLDSYFALSKLYLGGAYLQTGNKDMLFDAVMEIACQAIALFQGSKPLARL